MVSGTTSGIGNAGNVLVRANEVELIGRRANNRNASGLFTQINFSGTGNAGNLTIETGRLRVINGAGVGN